MRSGRYWDEETETAPWAEVEAWQGAQLAGTVSALRERSAFYRDKLAAVDPAAVRSLADLARLPFTGKDELRRAQDHPAPGAPLGTIQAAPLEDVVQVLSSSGTTGRPVYYGLTRRDREMWQEAIAGVFHTAGVRPDDVVAHLVSLPMVAGALPYVDAFRHLGAMVAWLGGLPAERMLAALRDLQTTALIATASFAVHLTDHCRDLIGCEPWELGVTKLIGGAEAGIGQPEIRRKIKEGWKISHVRECMGLGDVMAGVWAECEDESGMHLCVPRHVVVELVEPVSGEAVPWGEGAEGEAVYTTLGREATPVLRFRSADHLVVTGMGCACGRRTPKIRCVGRTDDMLIYKGMNVFPTAIRDVALRHHGDALEPYLRIWKERADQVRFDDPIPVEIEANPGADAADFEAIAARVAASVRQHLQVRVAVSVVPPGTIPRTAYKTALVHVRQEQAPGG